MKKSYQIGSGIAFAMALIVLYTNCSPGLIPDLNADSNLSNSVPGFECDAYIALRAEIPSTIDEMTHFINDLPKPLTIPCLIAAFQPPFVVYASASPLSAQPSIRPESPRIFIIKDNLLIGVVPEGIGKDLVEFGQITESMMTIKGELEFPIAEELSLAAPYDKVKDPDFVIGGTNCRFCHSGEAKVTNVGFGEAYKSSLSVPNPSHKIPVNSLKHLAANCPVESEPFRCALLRFVASQGIDVTTFPTAPL